MKTKILFYPIALIMMLSGLVVSAQAPTLGTAANFAIFSTDGAVSSNVTNSLMTHITGNVGTNTSNATSTGFGNVNGVMQDDNASSHQAATDLLVAYNQLNTLVANYFPSPLLGNGVTLTKGVYFINSQAVLDGNLILDAQNDPNALFVFQINGSFSTNAMSQITLVNGALACNVFWKVEGLVDMSTGTKMKGTVVANNAAILMAIDSNLEGRLLSTTGAITVSGIVAEIPIGCGSAILNGPTAPNLASAICYSVFSGNQNVTNSGITTIRGDVGTNVGLTSGFDNATVTGTIHPIPDASTTQCAADVLDVRTYLNALPEDIQLLFPAQFGNDLLLTPHTYLLNSATVLTNSLYLDAQNNPNAVFVIKIFGAFSTSTYAKVILLNGAQAKNIYWIVNGAVNINDYSEFKGTLVCNGGAVSVNTGATIEGRVLATSGAVSTFAITANITAGCTSLSVGSINETKQTIGVYPNPFNGNFTIQANEDTANSQFSLYDEVGKLIVQKNINQAATNVEINVAPGMYIYKYTNDAGLIQTGKLISK